MRIEEFPGCCTAGVLFDLGGSSAAMHRDEALTMEELEVEYKRATTRHDLFSTYDDEDEYENRAGNAVLVACTTTEQETANEFLKSKGFLCAGPYSKPKHPETGLYLWWLPLFGVHGTEG